MNECFKKFKNYTFFIIYFNTKNFKLKYPNVNITVIVHLIIFHFEFYVGKSPKYYTISDL